MQAAAWTEWLNSPETRALVAYLHRRRTPVVDSFLAGEPVPQVRQGRATAYQEIVTILTKPVDEVRTILGGSK